MGAEVDQFTFPENDDLIGLPNLRKAMGNEQRRAPLHDPVDRALDLRFGVAVDCAGGVVDDQDAWVGDERSGNGKALALTA